MPRPMCPKCEIEGVDHIASADSQETNAPDRPQFGVAFCDVCGHVYGVFARNAFAPALPETTSPFPELLDADDDD